MEYKNQTENRTFQEMLQAAVKRLQNRSGVGLFFTAAEICLRYQVFTK